MRPLWRMMRVPVKIVSRLDQVAVVGERSGLAHASRKLHGTRRLFAVRTYGYFGFWVWAADPLPQPRWEVYSSQKKIWSLVL